MAAVIVAYVPVLHRGYLHFFARHPQAKQLFLLGTEMTQSIEAFQKDLRAIAPQTIATAIQALNIFEQVEVLDQVTLESLANNKEISFIFPDEEIMHQLAEQYLSQAKITFDSVFLRWDSKSVLAKKEITPDTFMKHAEVLKEKSADWWRQVGAVIVKDGQEILSDYNHHLPSPLEPYFQGDPRASFHKGELIEFSTAIHAEASLIAQAAKQGRSLNQTELYVTTFPCPVCAKLIAQTGIKKVYFAEGYSLLDGEALLRAAGVEIIKVEQTE